MREPKIPLSVVREIISMQNEHITRVAEMMAEHLERTAELYERALNPPPLPPAPLTNDWRMTEAEEDARFQFDNKLISQAEFDEVLKDIAKAQVGTEFDE